MRPTKASTLLHSTLGHGVTNSSVVREESLTVALLHHLALMAPLLQDTTALPLTTTNTPLTTSMVSRTVRRATMKTTTARALPVQALIAKADTHGVVDATAAAAAVVALVDVEVLDLITADLTTGALTTAGLITEDLAVTAHANTMVLLMTVLVVVHEAPTAVLPAHLLTMVPEDLTKDLTAMVLAVTVAHVTTADLDATDPGVSTATSADHVVVAASAGLTQVLSGVQAQALTPPT